MLNYSSTEDASDKQQRNSRLLLPTPIDTERRRPTRLPRST